MTVMKPLLRVDARKTRSGLRKSTLAIALLVSGAASFAEPIVYNQSFTLSTANQSMWGTGTEQGWSYDSGVQGVKWGTYRGPNSSPEQIGVNAIAGDARETIFPQLCFWAIWRTVCTPAVKADTRTGAAIDLSSSGQLGVGVKASANGGGVSVVLPVQTTLTIGDAINGKVRVSGSAAIDVAKGGALISATAPSFKAGINAIVNVDASLLAQGCFFLAGCATGQAGFGFGFDQTLVAIDTSKQNPLSVLGFGIPVPGVNQYVEVRSLAEPCVGPVTAAGVKPNCDVTFGPLAAGQLKLLQVQFDTLKDFSGGQHDTTNQTLKLSNDAPVLTAGINVIDIAQTTFGVPANVVNPSVSLNIPLVGGAVSAGIKTADVSFNLEMGLKQSFEVSPSLQVTLQFDKPVAEYVKVVDTSKPKVVIGQTQALSFQQGLTVVNKAFKDYQQTANEPTDEQFALMQAGGCIVYKSGAGRVDITACSPTVDQLYGKICNEQGCAISVEEAQRLLKPDEDFRTDLPYYRRQCRMLSGDPYKFKLNSENSANSILGSLPDYQFECYTGAVLPKVNVLGDQFNTVLVERGTSVTIDLDKGADLQFIGDAGRLISQSYTMDGSDNFRSKAGISVGMLAEFQAACLKANFLSLAFNGCLIDDDYDISFGKIGVFDDSFALGGFNSVAFNAFTDPTDPGGNNVPEPSTLWLAALAMLGLGAVARRRSGRV